MFDIRITGSTTNSSSCLGHFIAPLAGNPTILNWGFSIKIKKETDLQRQNYAWYSKSPVTLGPTQKFCLVSPSSLFIFIREWVSIRDYIPDLVISPHSSGNQQHSFTATQLLKHFSLWTGGRLKKFMCKVVPGRHGHIPLHSTPISRAGGRRAPHCLPHSQLTGVDSSLSHH